MLEERSCEPEALSSKPMNIYANVLEMVGRTPMLAVGRMDTGSCRLLLKLELMNPGGSIMTHASVLPERRAELGISDTLIRLSEGIEDADDLIADLARAFGD